MSFQNTISCHFSAEIFESVYVCASTLCSVFLSSFSSRFFVRIGLDFKLKKSLLNFFITPLSECDHLLFLPNYVRLWLSLSVNNEKPCMSRCFCFFSFFIVKLVNNPKSQSRSQNSLFQTSRHFKSHLELIFLVKSLYLIILFVIILQPCRMKFSFKAFACILPYQYEVLHASQFHYAFIL